MDIINPPSPPQVSTTIGGSVVQFAEYDIGPWNMLATVSIDIAHSLTDITKVLSITAMIVADNLATSIPLTFTDGANENPAGSVYVDATNLHLIRKAGGFFADASYDDAVMNRGKVYIHYIP